MNKKTNWRKGQLHSFAVAFSGLKAVFQSEQNFRIHLVISVLALVCSFIFGITPTEWAIVLVLIGFVLCAEILNTAIEYLCDMISPKFHPEIKKIKDAGAAAVLFAAIIAVIVGCIIFIPYLISWLKLV